MRERRGYPGFAHAAVAWLAIYRKPGSGVTGVRGRFIILLVAGKTVERHIDELRFVLRLMAIIAAHVLMPTE